MTRSRLPTACALAAALVALLPLLSACSSEQAHPVATPESGPSPTESTVPQASSPPAVPVELELAPDGLEPLVLGHNRASADRINLVVAPWGWEDEDTFRRVATSFINWSGVAQRWGEDGMPLEEDDSTSVAVGAEVGLFGIEPFRGHRDAFNVWITTETPAGPYDWLDAASAPAWVSDQVIVVFAEQDDGGSASSSVASQSPAFGSPDSLGRSVSQPFGNATVVVNEDWVPTAMLDVPHELGHAMFGLADEYVGRQTGGDGEYRNPFWPSCADTATLAATWWSSNIGQYDDQLDYRARQMREAGFGMSAAALERMRDTNRTAYVDGGCFGVDGSVRSAEDSLMGFNFPAFGVTNRQWGEYVLGLWTGE